MYHQPKRIEFLDSIRGLAAMAVLLGHAVGTFDWPATSHWVRWIDLPLVAIPFDGRTAVVMFFVLSGFVLARPYLAKPAPGQEPRQLFLPTFYLRRWTRIWLPWFFVLCLSAIVRRFFYTEYVTDPPLLQWLPEWHENITWSTFFRQCSLVVLGGQRLLPQDWSLAVELKASAVIPVFIFLLRRTHSIWLLGLGILHLIFLDQHGFYIPFVMGALLAKHADGLVGWLRSLGGKAQSGILLAGILLYHSRYLAVMTFGWTRSPHLPEKYFWGTAAFGCLLLLTSSLSSRRLQAVLNHYTLVFLGRISFSIFLLHLFVILWVVPYMGHVLNGLGIHQTAVLWPMTLLVAASVTVGLAALTYRWVEMPSIEFGHWLTTGIQKRLKSANLIK